VRCLVLLPPRARQALLEYMWRHRGCSYATMAALAQKCSLASLRVAGAYGLIQGSPADTVILATYAVTGRWAHRANELLIEYFERSGPGTYIDIGANIGLTTIPTARNPSVACLAIEPEPDNYANLRANVARNCPHRNVTVKQLALYSRRATLRLELSADNLGDHRLRIYDKPGVSREQERRTVEIQAVPLDELAPAIAGPLAVKIDVQGAEAAVIAGGRRTLAPAQLLIMEFWPYGIVRQGADPGEVLRWVEETFATAGIGEGDSWPDLEFGAAGPCMARLRERMAAYRYDAAWQVDIVARK
jgi:FkbM family methyltransferase